MKNSFLILLWGIALCCRAEAIIGGQAQSPSHQHRSDFVSRSTPLDLTAEELETRMLTSMVSGEPFRLELFDGQLSEWTLALQETNRWGHTVIHGDGLRDPGLKLSFVGSGSECGANLWTEWGTFGIRTAIDGSLELHEVDPQYAPTCYRGEPLDGELSVDDLGVPLWSGNDAGVSGPIGEGFGQTTTGAGTELSTSTPCIDVLMVYSQQAANATSNLAMTSQLAVDSVNLAMQSSLANVTIRLANAVDLGSGLVEPPLSMGFLPFGTYPMFLEQIYHPADGIADNVPMERDTNSADLVILVLSATEPPGGFAGISRTQLLDVNDVDGLNAYGAVAFGAMGSGTASGTTLVLAHEVGHLMGLSHDLAFGSASGSHPWAHGYADYASSGCPPNVVLCAIHTVMATAAPLQSISFCGNPTTQVVLPFNRVPYYSNPFVALPGTNFCSGQPWGASGVLPGAGTCNAAYNVLVLNDNAGTVAAFR